MKASYPFKVAEYAGVVGVSDEPAFSWWDNPCLKKETENHSSSQQEIPQDDADVAYTEKPDHEQTN